MARQEIVEEMTAELRIAAIMELREGVTNATAECEMKQQAIERVDKEVNTMKGLAQEPKREVEKLKGEIQAKTREAEMQTKEMRDVETRSAIELDKGNHEIE
jgi:hypothetical protein